MKKKIAERIKAGLEGTALAVPRANAQLAEDLRRRWIRAAMDVGDIDRCLEDVRQGRVYTIKGISAMLQCSDNTIWRLFRKEPGVLRLRSSYRIPETVLQRVLTDILNKSVDELETVGENK